MKIAAAILSLLCVGVLWYAVSNRGKMSERIQILEGELAARTTYVGELTDSLTAQHAKTDSVVAKMDTVIADAADAARRARDSASKLGGDLHEHIGQLDLSEQTKVILRQELRELTGQYRAALAEKDEIIEAQLTQINSISDELALTLELNRELTASLETANDLLDEYRGLTDPNFLTALTRDMPEKLAWAGAGVLLGAVLSK